ncbi:MAG: sterol desaturase family protein [Acetobacteraceae bacterium]
MLSSFDLASFLHRLPGAMWERISGENGITLLLIWATMLLAVGVTFAGVPKQERSWRRLLHHVIPPGTLTHPSARADFLFWLSRRIFMPLLVLPLAISTVAAGHVMFSLLTAVFGAPAHQAAEAGPLTLVLFTVTMLLAYDLSYYLYHMMQHKIPLLWELHKVHHSAEVMVGVTKDRVHPVDEIMNRWWDGVIPGLCYGAWLFFVLDPVEVTVFGINVYLLRNTLLMMDFIRHTHWKLSYGRWLDAILLSPHYHQLHHSNAPQHWDRNYGLTLSVWDRLFGTLVVPKPNESFEFGLTHREHEEYRSVYRLHVLPLQKIARRLLRRRPARKAPAATMTEAPSAAHKAT